MKRLIIIKLILLLSVFGSFYAGAAELKSKAFDEAMRALEKAPNAVDAETHLIRIFTLWNDLGPEVVRPVLTRFAGDEKASPRLRSRARFLDAVAEARLGNVTQAAERLKQMGFGGNWAHAGPFSNEGGTGFDTAYAPEKEGSQDPDAPMEGKGRLVHWRALPTAAFHMGMVHLDGLYSPYDNSCAYSKTVLVADRAGSAILQLGAGGAYRAFWNGSEAVSDDKYRAAGPDRTAAAIAVKKGENTLLIKVCTEETGDFGFYARITDTRGNAYLMTAAENPMVGVGTTVSSGKKPRPLAQPADTLLARATARPNDAAAQSAAARYLYFTDGRDLNTNEGRDIAKAACEIGHVEADCLLWSVWAVDRNEERLALDRGLGYAPNSPNILLSLAEWMLDGPEPAQALPFLRRAQLAESPPRLEGEEFARLARFADLSAPTTEQLRGALLEIETTASRGYGQTAFKAAQQLAQAFPGVPTVIDFAKQMADISGNVAKGLLYSAQGVTFNFDEVDRHLTLANDALAKHDLSALDRHIDDMMFVAPYSDNVYVNAARLLEGAESMKRAEAILRQRLELAPENAGAAADLGMFLMRENRRDEGISSLLLALQLRPQDVWLAEYLQHLGPKEAFESSFIIPDTVFLASRNETKQTDESQYLVDQTVVEVYDSGLSSRFRQMVFQIGNRADAKDWRMRDIQYLPDTQQLKILAAKVYRKDGSVDKIINRGTVPISEPWYRLYYDVAAEVLEFPSLNLGDVVEISYRLDDVSTRNIFNDYFGDFLFIEETVPKQFWRYVVVAPKDRELRFNPPSYPLDRAVEEDGDKKVYSFEAREIPALHREADMPGMAEIAAYLHVSTYKSWADLGRWYQGLIRHQMVPDSRIRAKVKELIRGKKNETEKVQAIYDWVVSATRYVGLEFGIHGYKPYRASLVVSRGFGDCKDKASLLVTMLREAGIQAEFVLIRTGDLGLLTSEPASLSVFNHAIAYVPSIKTYLDGTAENHGIFELPFGDQGAFALILKDTGAELVTTPVEKSGRNVTSLHSQIRLDPEGNATLTSSADIRGSEAAALRRGLEAEATRRDRFEGSLASVYPGTHLKALKIESLKDLSKPVSYSFTAEIPTYATLQDDGFEVPIDDGLGLVSAYARLPERQYDLMVGPTRVMERSMVIEAPKGYGVIDLPKSTELSTRFGTLSVGVSGKDDTVHIVRRFELKVDRVTPDAYPEFVDFIRRVDETLAVRLIFRRPK